MDVFRQFDLIALWALASVGIYYLLSGLFHRVPGERGRPWRPKLKLVGSIDGRRASAGIDSVDQLRDVMAASFVPRKVMNREEYLVFKAIEDELRALAAGYRAFSQTALGEVIRSEDPRAHSAINSKRVDVLVISPSGMPELAVEYQGGGHYQRDAAARDAVKKEALRRAGVDYLEVFEHHGADEIRRLVREVLLRRRMPHKSQAAG